MAHDAPEADARQRSDIVGESHPLLDFLNAAALQPGLKFDNYSEVNSLRYGFSRQGSGIVGVVASNHDLSLTSQRAEATNFQVANDLTGDENTGDAAMDHYLGF